VFVKSFSSEYSLLPALGPGLILAASAPLSRAAYQVAIAVFYTAPAFLALGALARRIARPAGASMKRGAALALATAFALAASPGAMTLVTLGMPDIGALALVVAGLFLSERLARLLALPPGREDWVEAQAIQTGLKLAACLFAMFLFRRWYPFSALGLLAASAIEIALLAVRRGRGFRWRRAVAAGSAGGLMLLALVMPVMIDWLPDWRGHDYPAIYAAYDYDLAELTRRIGDFFGFAIPMAALASAALLAMRRCNHRLLRLTLISSAIAFAAMLHVQSPGPHHLNLLVPALTAPIGAAALVALERRRSAALAALIALLALALSRPPARSRVSRVPRSRPCRARTLPNSRACAAGSTHTPRLSDAIACSPRTRPSAASWPINSGSSIPCAPTFSAAQRSDVILPSVDGRDGPPGAAMKGCALLLVGDPVATSLPREFQLSVAIPAAEVLAGEGIGSHFRPTGEVFQLIGGVRLVAFERAAPLTDEDIAALRARWRVASRGRAVFLIDPRQHLFEGLEEPRPSGLGALIKLRLIRREARLFHAKVRPRTRRREGPGDDALQAVRVPRIGQRLVRLDRLDLAVDGAPVGAKIEFVADERLEIVLHQPLLDQMGLRERAPDLFRRMRHLPFNSDGKRFACSFAH
jgi:hypothetical protein